MKYKVWVPPRILEVEQETLAEMIDWCAEDRLAVALEEMLRQDLRMEYAVVEEGP